MFLYWQQSGGEEPWQLALATGRQALIDEHHPRFITVLQVSLAITASTTAAEVEQARYLGPLYFDFDGQDLEVVIQKFKQMLDKLQRLGVDLHSLHLFATGGRGFHILVPSATFLPKPIKAGIQRLPAIYKEMANDLYVDTLDLRVYSGRRGRMFRVENSLREGGGYKVPISVDEALNITPATYKILCSAPRQAPSLSAARLNNNLAVSFAQAEQKVAAAAKKKKDSSKDIELLARFKGQYPPTLTRIMAGQGVAEDVGFHQIAMQIAITSNALGKSEDDMLAVCEGLIANHQSDGSRYNTPQKRRDELVRMHRYTLDNVCYSYSKGAIKNIAAKGENTTDLDGLGESAGEVLSETDDNEDGYIGGVVLTEGGIYRKSQDGMNKICPLGFRDVHQMQDPESGAVLGFDVELLVDGLPQRRVLIDTHTFASRASFQKFAVPFNGGTTGTDNQIIAVQKLLSKMAMANTGITYRIAREGLDLIQRPGEDRRVWDMVWASPVGDVITDSPINYKYRGRPNPDGRYKSDLMQAPDFVADENSAQVIEAMLSMNEPYVIANVVGWFVSSFHRQVYHKLFKQFPLLHIFGQSGAGKTKTIEALLPLHYYLQTPVLSDATEDTPWAISGSMLASASIPLVIDEYKPRAMKPGRHELYKAKLRASYTAATYGKGGMSDNPNGSWQDISELAHSAPVVVLGEGLESETAFIERTVIVGIKKCSSPQRRFAHRLVRENGPVLSSLGKDIVKATFLLNLDQFKKQVERNVEQAAEASETKDAYRPHFNSGVVLTGLDFLNDLLAARFGDRFKKTLAELRSMVADFVPEVAIRPQPEAAKVLGTLALMSNTEDEMSELGLRIGVDYLQVKEGTIDLKMRNVYVKYAAWSRRKGVAVFYDTAEAFIHGLANYHACVNRACLDNKVLKAEGTEIVYRFDLAELAKDGVETFRQGRK